jgi:hypothetical protein
MLVLAVDVGIRNLAICAIDTSCGIVHWVNEPLSTGAYQPQHNVQYVHEFLARNAALFARADEIVVEKQMRVNMRIIEAVIQSRFFDKCKVVHPRTIKAAFGLGRGNYALNKKASVDFVRERLESLEQESNWRSFFANAKKRDDLADAYIMALFFSGGGRVSKPCSTLAQGRMAAMTRSPTSRASIIPEPLESSESSTCTPCLPCGSSSKPPATQTMKAPTSSNS